jgi:hypothetical protein
VCRASDYACDAWSDTCRKFSRNLALLYYIVALVLMWEFYRIYKENGWPAATLGAMKLGEVTKCTTPEPLIARHPSH